MSIFYVKTVKICWRLGLHPQTPGFAPLNSDSSDKEKNLTSVVIFKPEGVNIAYKKICYTGSEYSCQPPPNNFLDTALIKSKAGRFADLLKSHETVPSNQCEPDESYYWMHPSAESAPVPNLQLVRSFFDVFWKSAN